jgi:DNA recombination protein RmuC
VDAIQELNSITFYLQDPLLVPLYCCTLAILLAYLLLRAARLQKDSINGLVARLDVHDQLLQREFPNLRLELTNHIRAEVDSNTNIVKQEIEAILRRLHEHQQTLLQRESMLSERLMLFQNEQRAQGERIASVNNQQLEKFRLLLEEQLQTNLDKRLTQSFTAVAERLAQVHNSLGEMNQLAQGVGELQRVFSHVKLRGIWGEVQLEKLLEEMLAPGQFKKNFRPHQNKPEVVEFAVRFPGQDPENPVWLPVDAKFPLEQYEKIVTAHETGDTALLETSQKLLEQQIRQQARAVAAKYITPPTTTDFAIIFLPCESLYAEVLRMPGVLERIQSEYRVTISGPTTFSALLCSLQMGFRSLQIQERTTEVWRLLAKVRNDFGKFSLSLQAIQRKLSQASDQIEEAGRRSQIIQKNLNNIEYGDDIDPIELKAVEPMT